MTSTLEQHPTKLGTISPALQHLAAIAILEGIIFQKYPRNSQRLRELRQHSMEGECDAILAIHGEITRRRDPSTKFTLSVSFGTLLNPRSQPSITLQSITSPQGVILDCTGLVANVDMQQAARNSRTISRFLEVARIAASEDVIAGQTALRDKSLA